MVVYSSYRLSGTNLDNLDDIESITFPFQVTRVTISIDKFLNCTSLESVSTNQPSMFNYVRKRYKKNLHGKQK